MKTYLVEGKGPSGFDASLLKALPHPETLLQTGEQHSMRIGVEDEHGAIYRIIEVGDVVAKKKLIDALHQHNFWIEPLAPESEDSLYEVIKFGK